MRTEVDLENKDSKLREACTGPSPSCSTTSPKAVTVPSSSLLKQSSAGDGQVYVVATDEVHKVEVRISLDSSSIAEVLSGAHRRRRGRRPLQRRNGRQHVGDDQELQKLAQAGG